MLFEEFYPSNSCRMDKRDNSETATYPFQSLRHPNETIGIRNGPQMIPPSLPTLPNLLLSMGHVNFSQQKIRTNTGKVSSTSDLFSFSFNFVPFCSMSILNAVGK